MKRLTAAIFAILFIGGILFFYLMPPSKEVIETETPYLIDTCNRDKKKILIFSSGGGGGHTSVTRALSEYLQDDYCMGSTLMFTNVLKDLDIFQKISNEKVSFETFHNWFAKKKWFQFANVLEGSLGLWFFALNRKKGEKAIEEYIKKQSPDLIVSVIPVVNGMILSVAQKLNIPFLLVPTDLDASFILNQVDAPTYDKFYIAPSYDTEVISKQFAEKKIPAKNITYTGFPIKRAFLEPHNQRKIKKQFSIPEKTPVILLMMGALGSDELHRFARQLTKLTIPAHLIIAMGQSEHLRPQLERVHFPTNVTKSILGFTNQMPEIMAISDLFITKSGSVSVNEAIYSGLPMLLDDTVGSLTWEKMNSDFIAEHEFGDVIKKYYQIAPIVEKLISNKKELAALKKNIEAFPKKNPEQEFRLLVRRILSKQ
ncbi:glycosyltransferase [Candidatus Dependentiae bacterium]